MTRCALKKFGCKTVHPQLGHFLAEDDLRHHINVAMKGMIATFLAVILDKPNECNQILTSNQKCPINSSAHAS
jgi:HPt (histidine-containing phosphotransfer) domain-containing protein